MKLTQTCFAAVCFVTLCLAITCSSCSPIPKPPSSSNAAIGTAQDQIDPAREALKVKTLQFETQITAPVEEVWALTFSPTGYTKWTAPFMVGSYFEGSWDEGERIHFLAPGGSGMVAEIAENRRFEFVSIKHIGYIQNGVEDTTSDEVRSWAPAYENFHFAETEGGTRVTVEHEVLASHEGYMNQTWPKALEKLKALCEGKEK